MEARTWLPIGYRFRPTEEEMIKWFLSRKVRGQPLTINPIIDCDLYGNRPPWEIFHESCNHCDDNTWYCFTKLKMLSKSRVSRVAGGNGTWHGETSARAVCDSKKSDMIIGFKKTYTFKVDKITKTDWIMHEFRLADDDESSSIQVLCKIKKLKSKDVEEEEEEEDDDEEEEDEDEEVEAITANEEGSSRLLSLQSSVEEPSQQQDLLSSIWDDDLPSVMNTQVTVDNDAWIAMLEDIFSA